MVQALTERKAAATKLDGNKFLRKEERHELDEQFKNPAPSSHQSNVW